MIVLLVFLLASQDNTAVVIPGNAQVETGLVPGRLLADSLGFIIIDFAPVTQLVSLNPDPINSIRLDHTESPRAFSDISQHDLIDSATSQSIAEECLGEATQNLPLYGEEFQAWANLECSFLDTFKIVFGLSRGAHLMSAKMSNIKALKASKGGFQAPLSNQRKQLRSSRSILDKTPGLVTLPADLLSLHSPRHLMIDTQQPDRLRCEETANPQSTLHLLDEAQIPSYLTAQKSPDRIRQQASAGRTGLRSGQAEVTQGTGFAFTIHIPVTKNETELLLFLPDAPAQDFDSRKSLPSLGYWFGNSSMTLDSLPSLAYRETDIPRYWLPEIQAPQAIRREYHLSFHRPWLRDAVKKRGPKASNQNTQKTNGTLLSLLSNSSFELTLPSTVNLVPVPPPRLSLCAQKSIRYLLNPKDSRGQAKLLFQFRGHKPYVKQLLYSILKSQKDGVSSLFLDYYEAHITRHGLLRSLPALFHAIFSFSLVIVFAWAMGQWLEMLGNWPELQPFENEEWREFRRDGEALIRHFCYNVFRN